MAKGPEDLLKITTDDEEAVKSLENFIDNHSKMLSFDGNDVKIELPPELVEKHLGIRYNVRTNELVRRYRCAGWKSVWVSSQYNKPKTIELGRYERSYND